MNNGRKQSSTFDKSTPERQLFVGRVWDAVAQAPKVVLRRDGQLFDLSHDHKSVAGLLEKSDLLDYLRNFRGDLWRDGDCPTGTPGNESQDHLLSPVDLQVVKACGVTYIDSLLERVIEEKAGGDPELAHQVRESIKSQLGESLSNIIPGSDEAARVKKILQSEGMWSQYLEVGIGPDPEVFTKATPLASVGHGALIGIPDFSAWNNPEPELVLVVTSEGKIVGVALGNDVNLRDVEGRSALLLGMAKDNNASCSIGPFIRVFDEDYTLEDARSEIISLKVRGADGFILEAENSVDRLSRPFEELVAAAYGIHHQYPDGFALFTGTLFAPTKDRLGPGEGFTHKMGDRVTIESPNLGVLENTVATMEQLPKWTFGIRQFIRSLEISTLSN